MSPAAIGDLVSFVDQAGSRALGHVVGFEIVDGQTYALIDGSGGMGGSRATLRVLANQTETFIGDGA